MLFESPSILTFLTLFVFGLLKPAINYFEGFTEKNSGGNHFCLSSSVALCPKLVIFGKIILLKWNFVLFSFQNHASSWPFQRPVEISEAPDYYDHIKYPMGELIKNYIKCSKIHLKFFFANNL